MDNEKWSLTKVKNNEPELPVKLSKTCKWGGRDNNKKIKKEVIK